MCDINKLHIRKKCSTPTGSIALFVRKDGIDVGICNACWNKIAEKEWEIGDYVKPENFKEWLEKGRGIEKGIPTEYNPSKTGKGRYKEIEEPENENADNDNG